MLAASFILMYAIMFLNVNDTSHIYINMTRCYMTLMMVTAMAVFMLAMMPAMYPQNGRNVVIIVTSIVLFIGSFIGVHNKWASLIYNT